MNYLKLNSNILNSYFYRFILTSRDKVIFQTLLNSIICDNFYYKNNLLVINSKYKTLAKLSGESLMSVRRSLNKLNELGVIIKVKRTNRTIRYLVGFRLNDNNRVYLIEHHIQEYDKWIRRIVENKFTENYKVSLDHTNFILDNNYRLFIEHYINKPNILFNKSIYIHNSRKTLFEVLFNKPLDVNKYEKLSKVIQFYN